MDPVAEVMDEAIRTDPGLKTRSDAIQDAMALWAMLEQEKGLSTNGHGPIRPEPE